ncbi:hypothetical protein H4582DRAFT_1996593 [Lactarius indigo]|nr:hypothetical protein H4582DRAFT_1996593 [Lactarius indigo]
MRNALSVASELGPPRSANTKEYCSCGSHSTPMSSPRDFSCLTPTVRLGFAAGQSKMSGHEAEGKRFGSGLIDLVPCEKSHTRLELLRPMTLTLRPRFPTRYQHTNFPWHCTSALLRLSMVYRPSGGTFELVPVDSDQADQIGRNLFSAQYSNFSMI